MLVNTTKTEVKNVDTPFADVNGSERYAPFVSAAFESGCFNPNSACTRAEAAKIIHNLFFK